MNADLAYLLGIIALFILTLGLLWFLIIRYEMAIRGRWHEFLDYPRISALRKRFSPQLVFLRNRLTPGGYLRKFFKPPHSYVKPNPSYSSEWRSVG